MDMIWHLSWPILKPLPAKTMPLRKRLSPDDFQQGDLNLLQRFDLGRIHGRTLEAKWSGPYLDMWTDRGAILLFRTSFGAYGESCPSLLPPRPWSRTSSRTTMLSETSWQFIYHWLVDIEPSGSSPQCFQIAFGTHGA